MCRLKPGATYVYERIGDITYAREVGTASNSRFEIGRSVGQQDLDEHNLWIEIRRAAKTNATLQAEMDRVKILYYLIKDEQPSTMHHSV
jgi:hypothetical protein